VRFVQKLLQGTYRLSKAFDHTCPWYQGEMTTPACSPGAGSASPPAGTGTTVMTGDFLVVVRLNAGYGLFKSSQISL
jgi:hypothetical protein